MSPEYSKCRNSLLFFLFLSGLFVQAESQTKKLFILDPLAVSNFKEEVAQAPGDKIFRLPADGNPIILIAEELSKTKFDQIHIYVLTKPGSLIFDEANIIMENIADYYSAFKSWRAGLNPGCSIILHSEDFLQVPEGEAIRLKIEEYTDCKVTVIK
jgi:hypothetical protein